MGKDNSEDIYEKTREDLQKLPNRAFNFAGRIFGKKIAYVLAIIFFLAFFLFRFGIIKMPAINLFSDKKIPQSLDSNNKQANQTPLEKERIHGIAADPCGGQSVDIMKEFGDVSEKEKLVVVESEDPSVVSAPESGNFQGSKRYPFACSPPWVATFSATPRKEQSIGIFLEFEDGFKILIGDGDRISWKVEKNDKGRRETWTEVKREELLNGKISKDHQVTIVVEAALKDKIVNLKFKINYVPEGEQDYVWEGYEISFQPKSINLDANPSQKFRIGINDWRFKGKGSEVKFGVFSVKEIK